MDNLRVFIILIAFVPFSGCSGPKVLAPLEERNQPPSTKVSHHTVAPGETLYSIAWRYDLDYKLLAKSNNIGLSYDIYPGQRIVLKEVKPTAYRPSSVSSTQASLSSNPEKTHTQVANSPVPDRLKNSSKVVKNNTASKWSNQKLNWSWPANGSIAQRFNSRNGLNKGIDITGKLGEPVHAASSGTVVYSGEGLRGYGKLVIIKHSEKYLSAYAHNRKLLVSEGDKVVRKDKIAEMGKSGTDSVKLHFEIRYDGKPIDPLVYLPPK